MDSGTESGMTTMLTDVAGKIVDEFGAPMPNAKVGVGTAMATAGADGSFHILAPATYDLVIVHDNAISASGKRIALFAGLTTRTPTFQVLALQNRTASVAISGTNRTVTSNDRLAFLLVPNGASHAGPMVTGLPAGQATGLANVNWQGAATVSGSIYAIHYGPPGANNPIPTSFLGGDLQMFSNLTNAMTLMASTWTFGNAPPPSDVTLTINYGGKTGSRLDVLYRPDPNGTFVFNDNAFQGETMRTFKIPGVGSAYKGGVVVIANTPSGGACAVWKNGIAPAMGGVMASVAFPMEDLTSMQPADGAMVDKAATFQWSTVGNAMYRTLVVCPGTAAPQQIAMDVLSSKPTFQIPDVAALGANLSGMSCKWIVMAFPGAKNTDDLATPTGWQSLVDSYRSPTDGFNLASKQISFTIK